MSSPPGPAAGSYPRAGIAATDRYLETGFASVIGMSSRFAAGICGGLMRMQAEMGVRGHVAEVGAFEGRFLIALGHALGDGEVALGMDLFTWPNVGVQDRFRANCARHGLPEGRYIAWQVNSGETTPDALVAKLPATSGHRVRLFHIDGEHSRKALAKDLELATAVLEPGGLIVLDDMLHPGYPTLVTTVQEYLGRHPEIVVLCVIDRESIVAATKFVLCEANWFKRYEARILDEFKDHIWPMGADFEGHWCAVLSLDTRLAAVI